MHNDACSIYQLWENIQSAWADYPSDKLGRAFQTRKITLQMMIQHEGGNRFNIRHIGKAKREKLLPKT